jgi:hypothetical protein
MSIPIVISAFLSAFRSLPAVPASWQYRMRARAHTHITETIVSHVCSHAALTSSVNLSPRPSANVHIKASPTMAKCAEVQVRARYCISKPRKQAHAVTSTPRARRAGAVASEERLHASVAEIPDSTP